MSDDSTYLGLCVRVFDDLCAQLPCYTPRHANMDRATYLKRYSQEGMSFLTKTLPALGKHLESALESGTFKPYPAFERGKGQATPNFLGPLFKEIFDEDGVILDSANAKCIGAIRQVCYFMYKFDSDYPPALVDKVVNDFVDVDKSLKHCEEIDRQQRLLLTIAGSWLFRIFHDFDPHGILPRPGPGASASGTHESQRFEPLCHYSIVHEQYPYYRYFYMGSMHVGDRLNAYRSLPRKEFATSQMRIVPKDSRGPRLICMEEQELMFLQQGLGDAMRKHMERHPLTKGHVNFRSQEVNRVLAQASSITREFATLDMKEASDRIARLLVSILFERLPKLRNCLLALSTPAIRLPNGDVVQVNKFAPMGSSLCFPIMSIVHYALGVAAMHVHTAKPVKALAKNLYVYGDDIIVKSEYASCLFETFPLFGLEFNRGKSFVSGYFRESCGMDAFKGINVTPQRIKRRFFDGQDPRNLSAVMDMYRNFKAKGFNCMAAMLRTLVDSRYGKFPVVGFGSPFLGWCTESYETDIETALREDFCGPLSPSEASSRRNGLKLVWHSDWQTYTCSARVIETEPDCAMLGGWEQLMRSNLSALRDSTYLDGRWSKKEIFYQRLPLRRIHGLSSNWLPPYSPLNC